MDNWIQRCFELDRAILSSKAVTHRGFIEQTEYLPGLAFIFKKEFFLRLNGYDESIYYFEDVDITERAYKYCNLFYDPELVVWHIDPDSLRLVFNQGRNSAKGDLSFIGFLRHCFQPVCVALFPIFLIVALVRTLNERHYASFKIAVLNNFIIKPVRGFGMFYQHLLFLFANRFQICAMLNNLIVGKG